MKRTLDCGVRRHEMRFHRTGAFGVFLLFIYTGGVSADEIRCKLDDSMQLEYEPHEHGQSRWIRFTFPLSVDFQLYDVRLWRKPGEMPEFLECSQLEAGYVVNLSVTVDHDPMKLVANYHYKGCYALLEVTIDDGSVSKIEQ